MTNPYTDNLRKYVADIKARQATPLICTLIPRNTWADGKLSRTDQHAVWARSVATQEKVPLLDLNNAIADEYDKIGKEATAALFESGPHTNRKGAELNANVVYDLLRAFPDDPVKKFVREKPAANW